MRVIDVDAYKKQLCKHCLDKAKYGESFCPCGRVLGIELFPTIDVEKLVSDAYKEGWSDALAWSDGRNFGHKGMKGDE